MYKAYLMPDATGVMEHHEVHLFKELFWDPGAESDAYAIMNPKWKEELNKAAFFEFTVLPSNVHYGDFHKRKTVVMLYDDDELLFEGSVSACPKDFYNQRKVTCRGVLAYLCDSIQAPDEKNDSIRPVSKGDKKNHSGLTVSTKAATKETLSAHLTRLLDVHNSQVDFFKIIHMGGCVNDTTEHEFKTSNYRTTWDAIENDILDDYGRYLQLEYTNNDEINLNYCEIFDLAGRSKAPVFEFGKNMIEMTESDDSDSDIFTVLVPIGKNGLTVKNVTGHDSGSGTSTSWVNPYVAKWPADSEDDDFKRYVVVSDKAIKRFGRIVKTVSFSDVSDANTLYTKTVEYIHNNFDYHLEYEVKGIDAHYIDPSKHPKRIRVGHHCVLRSQYHSIDGDETVGQEPTSLNESKLFVISAEYDLINPENDTYKVGVPSSDREAKNNSLSGQTSSSSSKSSSNAASGASAAETFYSALQDYITPVAEWGLELNARLDNKVESNDSKYMTRFYEDEYKLQLTAERLFGEDESSDMYIRVPDERIMDTTNPAGMGWYEKNGSHYTSTLDTSPVAGKAYYYLRLWERVSSITVEEGGIHARVNGNYDRSIASSSWIELYEDKILALTGHIHIDGDGNVIVDSGAGFRTGHQETENTGAARYVRVPKSWYTKTNGDPENPKTKGWYEKRYNNRGNWMTTINNGYKLSEDTVADTNKAYYYESNQTQTLSADFGVYDEGNLTAGILVQAINNPTFERIPKSTVVAGKREGISPAAEGWYIFNNTTGLYALSAESEITDVNTPYYRATNNQETWTYLRGDRIVIGADINYTGLDPITQQKVDRYLAANTTIQGTITHIASDITVVNALFAKYIETEYLVSEENELTHIYADDIIARNALRTLGDAYLLVGSKLQPNGYAVSSAVKSFGTPTYSGDNVSIPYFALTTEDRIIQGTNPTPTGTITFTKPASLGSVTWSSGNKTLTAKTAGGRDFLVGEIRAYAPSSQQEAQQMQYAGYLDTEETGYSTTYGIYYTNYFGTAMKTMLFKTPKDRFEDGKEEGSREVKSKFGLYGPNKNVKTGDTLNQAEAQAMASTSTLLDYDATYMVYKTYDGSAYPAHGEKVFFKTKPDRYDNGIAYAKTQIGLYGPSAAAISGLTSDEQSAHDNPTTINRGDIYAVSVQYGGAFFGTKKFFRAPKIVKNDVNVPWTTVATTKPSSSSYDVEYSSDIKQLYAPATGTTPNVYWLYFTVNVDGITKTYLQQINVGRA